MHKNGEKGLNIIDIMIFRYESMFPGRERERERGEGREKEIRKLKRICLAIFPIKLQYIFLQKKLPIFFLYSNVEELEVFICFHSISIYDLGFYF